MQVTQAAKGQKSFFRTNNGGYGVKWESTGSSQTQTDPNEVPQYRELVSLHPTVSKCIPTLDTHQHDVGINFF